MEVSNEIKEDIRKTQSDLKNAIRIHQVWVARLQQDENNIQFKSKVKDAENDIIAIGQTQKLVVERLRRELELYQQRLKARNKQINIENDNRFVAQQLRDHQIQHRNRNRSVSLLKPSVLNEIHIKSENLSEDGKINNISELETEIKIVIERECSDHSDVDDTEKCPRNFLESRSNFANALNKVKEAFGEAQYQCRNDWQEQEREEARSESDLSPHTDLSPTPSPPPLPEPGEPISQETFMRLLGLLTPAQKTILEKRRSERRKRSSTSTNKNDFIYGNYDTMKRKKYNQFSYLQTHHDPPQTRSAKLRKQQHQKQSSREGSPSGSSSENKGWTNGKPAWTASLPAGLTVEPVYSPSQKVCQGCGRNDVPSLLVECSCGARQHTSCGAEGAGGAAGPGGAGGCAACARALPEPALTPRARAPSDDAHAQAQIYRDKIAERKRLQEKNIQLCMELRKLEARAATLKDNLDEHNAEKRQLLSDQIKTQRNLQKLLDFISQFKETSLSLRSISVSETGSEVSKSNEE